MGTHKHVVAPKSETQRGGRSKHRSASAPGGPAVACPPVRKCSWGQECEAFSGHVPSAHEVPRKDLGCFLAYLRVSALVS